MLILARKLGESIYVGDDIKIVVTEIGSGKVRIGIDAPGGTLILRSELQENGEQHHDRRERV